MSSNTPTRTSLLATTQCREIEVAPHRGSTDVFDVFRLDEATANNR
jgi:hypothetical protein